MKKTTEGKGDTMVKTTLRLTAATWRAGRVRALDEGTSFQEIVEIALRRYLKTEVPDVHDLYKRDLAKAKRRKAGGKR